MKELDLRDYRIEAEGEVLETGICNGAQLRRMREIPEATVTGRYLIEYLLNPHAVAKDIRRPSAELQNTRKFPLNIPKNIL